jgi:hypothetical protein
MSDNPSQQHVFEGSVDRKAERDARAKREADADAARAQADKDADAAIDKEDADKANALAEATHHGEVDPPHPDDTLPTAEGQVPTGNAAPPPGDAEAAAQAKADEESMRRAEDEKAQRAEAGHTAALNGDVAGVAFAPDIEQAKFELRNLGHDFTISLIDRMFQGIQRLEQKLMGG